jgi:type I restriction-modification system DNA methylase subunit
MGDSLVLSDVENSILENNLYGVDLNDESIEIAKLSLWLRTAQKGRKLNSLNNNIKCGNSLIDDPEVAGDKAFSWEKEFPEVFAKGGFDVIIGNPPYVVLSSFEDASFEFLQKRYTTSFGRLNTFALFIELITLIVKKQSKSGIIIPDSLCLIDYYSNLRKYLLDNNSIEELIELGDGIFSDATVPAIILIIGEKKVDNLIKIGDNESILNNNYCNLINQKYYYETPKHSFNLKVNSTFTKLISAIDGVKCFALKDVFQIKIGVCTGNNKLHLSEIPNFQNSKKVLQGRDIDRYKKNYNELYLNYDREKLLRARDESIFKMDEKLLMRQTSDKLVISYDNEQLYTIDSLFIIYSKKEGVNLKYALAILNSTLLNWLYQKINPEAGRVFAQVKIDYVNELVIKVESENNQLPFIEKANLMLSLNENFQIIVSKFIKYFSKQYQFEKLTGKLQKWYELEFQDFIKELNKAIKTAKGTPLTKKDEFEWMELFEDNKKNALALKAEIDKTDKEIDQMVYALYGLTEEEIKIVEGV